ncbi:MAG: SPASM domain-containing protein [bacterium]|nr:SPASM domain-containing protein [bacterium]
MSLSVLMRKVSAESLGKAFSYKNCLYPLVNLDITPSGDVCPCLTVKLGNVRDNSLQEIWRGEKAEQFRRALARDGFWSQCALCCEACVK